MLQELHSGLHYYISNVNYSNVAGFDLDWTLVRSVKGKFFKDSNDWKFLPNRLLSLKYYQDNGYLIIIFTNQGYKGIKLTEAIIRINNIIKFLAQENIHPWVFAATGANSFYRKPNYAMWQTLNNYKKDINLTSSFYVGDAADRPQDFSSSDKEFASNIGISFYTPEEIFPNNEIIIPETQTMFIFMGIPGSGKTSFYQRNLQPLGWIHINQDTLKTQNKVIATLKAALQAGKSVAIDATNPSSSKRKEYLSLAAEYRVSAMIIYFVGNGYAWNKLREKPVPNIAYNMYYKNLEEPSLELDSVPVVEVI